MVEALTFITVTEVKNSLYISKSKADHVIHDLSEELKAKGYMVVSGRVSRQYFNERFYGICDEEKEENYMSAYKDKKRGTWYISFQYKDWTGEIRRKLKCGFATKCEASEWEDSFKVIESTNLDMTFGDLWEVYEKDMKLKLKLKYNT